MSIEGKQLRELLSAEEYQLIEFIRSRNISGEELLALKLLWAKHFLNKATEAADKAWVEKGYKPGVIEQWVRNDEKQGGTG
jgi:hypothetical protein